MDGEMRKAMTGDETELVRFYEEVCAAQADSEYGPRWHYGIYPAAEDLIAHVRAGECFLCRIGSEIAAACILSSGDDPLYRGIAWPSEAPPEESRVVHLFAVHPRFRGMGVADTLLDHLIAEAGASQIRALRLDVLKGNLPAERLYQKHGFRFVRECTVFYEDTGEVSARLYELDLQR